MNAFHIDTLSRSLSISSRGSASTTRKAATSVHSPTATITLRKHTAEAFHDELTAIENRNLVANNTDVPPLRPDQVNETQTTIPKERDEGIETNTTVSDEKTETIEATTSPTGAPPASDTENLSQSKLLNEKPKGVELEQPNTVDQSKVEPAKAAPDTKAEKPTRGSVASSDPASNNATAATQQQHNTNNNTEWAAICAVTSHNDNFVNDWTDYHLALGFDIFLYNTHPNYTLKAWHDQRIDAELQESSRSLSLQNTSMSSSDATSTTARRVHLEHYILPEKSKNLPRVQQGVYTRCLATLRALPVPPKWVLVIDGDEYLVIRDMDRYPHIVPFLQERVTSGSLQINWIVMGSAYEQEFDATRPVPQRFPLAIVDEEFDETKTVAVLDHVDWFDIHDAKLKVQDPGQGSYPAVGMGGRKPGSGASSRKGIACIHHGDVSEAAVFHYKYMSNGEYNYRQCVRGAIEPVWDECPAVSRIGSKWDGAAWRAMQRLLPKYADKTIKANLASSDVFTKDTVVLAVHDDIVAANSTVPWLALFVIVSDNRGNVTEWLDYHVNKLGVGHVYLYDTRSTINTASAASSAAGDVSTWREANKDIARGQLSLVYNHVPVIAPSSSNTTVPTKATVFRDCFATLSQLPNPPTWFVVLEGDEYLVYKNMEIQKQHGNKNNITAYLVQYDPTGSSQLNWVDRDVALGLSHASTGHVRNTPVEQIF